MPTTSPCRFSSGPPLLPGLIAESVWRKSRSSGRPLFTMRSLALTRPDVTVWLRPSGLPIAITISPTPSASESPRGSAVSPGSGSIRSNAVSVRRSMPMIRATCSLRRCARTTRMSVAFSTTWALVRM